MPGFLRTIVLAASVVFPVSAAASFCAPYCGTPVSEGERPVAVDCLFILKAAVGSAMCEPECVCRVTGGESVSAADALTCLRSAIADEPLSCDCAASTTTTTVPAPVGTCSETGAPCASLFDCHDECFGSCEASRDACFATAEEVFDECVEPCPPGDNLCFRLCLLERREIEMGCRRALENCVMPCEDELCNGLYEGPRFEDTGPTVIDYQTRLEWEKKTPENVSLDFTWTRDFGGTKRTGTAFTVLLASMNDDCRADGGCYAGKCDWRLPTSSGGRTTGKDAELESLRKVVLCPAFSSCDAPVFGTVVGEWLWSDTTTKASPQLAWMLSLGTSSSPLRQEKKSSARPVRAVRWID